MCVLMHKHTKMYVCNVCMYMHACLYACMYVCMFVHVCMHVCMHVHVCMNGWTYIEFYVWIYVCMCPLWEFGVLSFFSVPERKLDPVLMSGPCGATLAMCVCVCVSAFVAEALLLTFVRNALLTVDGEGAKCGLVQRHVVLPWCPLLLCSKRFHFTAGFSGAVA